MIETLTLFPVEQLPTTEPTELEKLLGYGVQETCSDVIIGEIMEEQMAKHGLTLAKISHLIDVPIQTLFQWRQNLVAPMMSKDLLKLARLFKVSLEYLCFGIGSDEDPFKEFENESA
jgi:hypothetical protein